MMSEGNKTMAWMILVAAGLMEAVWVGIGAATTVIYGMVSGSEPVNIVRILLIAGLIGCVMGLKLAGGVKG